MRQIRLFSPQDLQAGTSIELSGPPAHHLLRVLRRQVGDAVTLFNGDGLEHVGKITSLEARDRCRIDLHSSSKPGTESPLQTTLVQAIGRGDRMDWAIQKCVELGVQAIQPVTSERTEVHLSGSRAEKRQNHWQQVVISACEQSGRVRVPRVAPIRALQELPPAAGTALYLDPTAQASTADLTIDSQEPLQLAVGPEGGFSPGELDHLAQQGYTGLRLGPRVLRTETAGAAVLAILQSRFGDV